MTIRVGIPRALLYYYYFPMWRSFFESLGAEVVVSPPTNKTILGLGLQQAGDDVCLPVKLAFGHVLDLKDRVDLLFLPRLVSVARREYICPKFLGFPDMVRQNIPGLPPLLDKNINLYHQNSGLFDSFCDLGRYFTGNRMRIYLAYRQAMHSQTKYMCLLEGGLCPEEAITAPAGAGKKEEEGTGTLTVAVIGHPYNIYDSYISMNILRRLHEAGIRVVTADHLPESVVRREAATLPKRLFWTLGQRMIGAAFYYLKQPEVLGIIHVASFACGPDSMTGELIERRVRRQGQMPFLNLILDEHTGEAGVVTRLEAFLDMLQRREVAVPSPRCTLAKSTWEATGVSPPVLAPSRA